MSISTTRNFGSTLLQLDNSQWSQLYYLLLIISGAVGALAFRTKSTTKSNISTIDGPAPSSMVWGSACDMFDDERGLAFQDDLMKSYGSACRIQGPLGTTELWISDPRAIQEVLVKGYYDFKQTSWFNTWVKLVLGPVVATLHGQEHKTRRKILNPVSTASHVRNSAATDAPHTKTPTMTSIARKLHEIVASEVQVNGGNTGVVDLFKWIHLISLEIIGQAGIGHSFGILEGKVPDYLAASRDVFALISEMWYLHPFIAFLTRLGPASFRRAVVEHIAHPPAQKLKDVADTMHNTATEIMKNKKEALENGTLDSGIAAGKDMMTGLLKRNLASAPQDRMTEEELLCQVNGLLFAAHDTTSSALSCTINLLAEHQEVQAKLRDEIRGAYRSHGKDLDYDQLNSLPYLDAVCRESLRIYAPAPLVVRIAAKDWTLPLYYPIKSKDGKLMSSTINVSKGTAVYISFRAANRDERTWGSDAGEFRPDRWLKPLLESVSDARMPSVYSSIMTFSGGLRSCPGMKFALLEMKTILSTLISNFNFDLSEEQIKWKAAGVIKPHIQYPDSTTSKEPMMPMKVTLLSDME
ncbi:cytochrome P450 family protein [Rhizoctonia solani]|uniref:Cytochrome P450 family protein n=1 Tax=Rhizoctonia solani TaxID=456999 RepID=A0A8H8T278_9AGAM|nr:cytochrome P450 family protein [Rhizoctonia solani]QRW26064.1 cytochrome P450 family protein [Rhizoctonia solani]